MAVGSTKEFIECLKATEILESEKLEEWLEKHPTDDVKRLAGLMVQDGILTAWQAKLIYAGRKKLSLGNYSLLDRISKDDLGDRFRATHRSLDRPVEIQLLPKRISENVHLQKSFISNIGMVSELDHPHIAHLHDVDQEGSQFFLVSEAHGGTPIDQIRLTAEGLALCTHQVLRALAFAHSNGVVHGEVSSENIACVNRSQFKLSGLGLSLIRRKLSGQTDATARDDMVALATLLEQRFTQLPDDCQQEFAWLGSHLKQLKSDPIANYPRMVVATEKVTEGWGESLPNLVSDGDVPAPNRQPTTPSAPQVSEPTPATIPKSDSPKATVETPSAKARKPVDSHQNQVASPPWKSPIGLAAIGIGSAILLVGILYGSGVFSSRTTDDETAQKPATQTPITEKVNDEKVSEDDSPPPSKGSEIPSMPEKIRTPSVAPQPKQDEADSKQDTSTEPTPTTSTPKVTVTPKTETPDPEVPKVESSANNTNPKPETTKAPNEDPEADQNDEDQLVGIPEVIDLPTSDTKEDFTLGELSADENLDSLEILSAPVVFSNGKGAFQLDQRNETSWDIQLLNKPGGTGEVVATIEHKDEQLTFAWNSEVGKKSKANALRNCILKLAIGETTKEVVLRAPVQLDIKLNPEKYGPKIDTDAEWLPQSEAIRVKVAPPSDPWPRRLYFSDGDSFLETFLFDENLTPMAILFNSDEKKQFLSVMLQPVISRKLAFNLGVFAKGKNTDAIQYKSFQTAEQTIQLLQQARDAQSIVKQEAAQAVDHARQIRNGTIGKRETEERAARKTYEEINDNVEISTEIRDQLDEIHNAPLPITVYFELEGRQIVLAETPSAEDSDEDENPRP